MKLKQPMVWIVKKDENGETGIVGAKHGLNSAKGESGMEGAKGVNCFNGRNNENEIDEPVD